MFDGSLRIPAGPTSLPPKGNLNPQLRRPCIGLFDSGVGGLSVLRALQREMPGLDYVYCGDTARLPYGKRKPETIVEYSLQASRFLIESGVDIIVIACNTASSVALSAIQQTYPDTLVKGVVKAGAQAATRATRSGNIAVIGTECTVESKAYETAINKLVPTAEVQAQACPFLVSLAEEGWTNGDIAHSVVQKYLDPLFANFAKHKPDTLILGCTHFSQFSSVINDVIGNEVKLIDPANYLAQELSSHLTLQTSEAHKTTGHTRFHATDAPNRFARVGELFLDNPIPFASLQLVTLDNQ